MTDLFWPGDHRAGDLMSDATFLAAMLEVENSWLSVLVEARVAPAAADTDLTTLVPVEDAEAVAAGAEADGSPVTGLVALLRERAGDQAGRWLHRGLTSQDVIDTALMLCLRDALARIHAELSAQVRTLVKLVETHHRRPTLARTLTQPALPTTLGAKMANWLSGVLDAAGTLTAVSHVAGSGWRRGRNPGRHDRIGRLTGRGSRLVRSVRREAGIRAGYALADHPLGDHPRRRCAS